ncbi:hypothetical protein BU26DRAFT_551148 [Trematosphaeria pertusa]|uniref:Uncharacterized protein n=1 Tax=Trematosphaeria pertusa TaxID=390896 RepID=A0A6A6IGX2_9PLEO|nr:uncharacterized protein BU26DRAFT_551148 [Trematosphaeria pertusa]KAF2249417.1 hypothetical protein BU26DRAFT_551148 [Trematosphaeria pertusa]
MSKDKTNMDPADKDAAKPSETGDPLAEPLQLFTPMTIPFGTSLTVTSLTSITVNGPIVIQSTAPITIKPTHATGVQIALSKDLGADFVHGWNKLPDELKVRILSFNLTRTSTFGYFDTMSCLRSLAKGILGYLCTTPEIAGLAREVFYSTNTFRLQPVRYSLPSGAPTDDLVLAYPSRGVNSRIRKLEIRVCLDDDEWPFLERLAEGAYGFENLQYVIVVVDISFVLYSSYAGGIYTDRRCVNVVDILGDRVRFRNRGELEFRFEEESEEEDGADWDFLMDMVREAVVFLPEE